MPTVILCKFCFSPMMALSIQSPSLQWYRKTAWAKAEEEARLSTRVETWWLAAGYSSVRKGMDVIAALARMLP